MILEEETFKKYGYYSTDLTPQSKKRIIVACDRCGKLREIRKSQYYALCLSCANTGRPVSKETRKKLSIAGKGRCLSEEHKKKLIKANTGRRLSENQKRILYEARKGSTHTEESRRKMSDSRRGKHPSKKTRKKMSNARKGKNNPNWHGGVSFGKYCPKFNNAFKEYIRTKFGRVCFLCSKTEEENGQKLSVHHVNYDKNCGCADTKEDKKADDEACQFVPLCVSCNTKVNSNRDKWEKRIKNKLRNKLNGWYI